jgi:light-regulated signal transduction histidine kinase (bacteriophytochrome)
MIDVTERKKAEEQLLSVNNLLHSFSYSVSHDLRAPLRHINGFIDLFRKKAIAKLDEKEIRFLNIITDSAQKMGVIIDELLAFSRLGTAPVNKEKVNMNLVVEDVLKEIKNGIKDQKVEWVIRFLPECEGDVGLLKLVFTNLLSNALKYSSKVEKSVIEIGTDTKDEKIVYFVRDNGAGFDMKYQDKLFGVFQRLHTEDEFEGIGIGLANVKRILDKHGGEIWAESKVNEGATFYFTISG